MKLTAAVTKEQNATFTVLLVKNGIIHSTNREDVRDSAPMNLPRPIILAEQRSNGRMNFHGRKDIVNFLSKIDYRRLPWKDYTY